jgi:hypothetical protein
MRCVFLALAFVAATACGGSPTQPNPVTEADGWGGAITFSQATVGGFTTTIAWTGTVFWDSPLALNGVTSFGVRSASVSATYVETAPCQAHGSAGVADVTINPQRDSKLVVQKDGSYTGSFHAVATILVTTAPCGGDPVHPEFTDPVYVGLDLAISGKANGASLRGNMAPVVLDQTTYKGSWDFATTASQAAR